MTFWLGQVPFYYNIHSSEIERLAWEEAKEIFEELRDPEDNDEVG